MEGLMITSKGTRYRGLPVLSAIFEMREEGNHVGPGRKYCLLGGSGRRSAMVASHQDIQRRGTDRSAPYHSIIFQIETLHLD